nr:ATP-binding protein [Anaerolineae bacterium]
MRRILTVEANLENLSELRKFIETSCDAADLDVSLKYDLTLAVDETCTNIAMHGYEGTDRGPITLTFESDAQTVTITVSDEGHPFDPKLAPTPDLITNWQERPVGGLGVFLVKQIADEVSYQTDSDGTNHLTMIKRLTDKPSEKNEPTSKKTGDKE